MCASTKNLSHARVSHLDTPLHLNYVSHFNQYLSIFCPVLIIGCILTSIQCVIFHPSIYEKGSLFTVSVLQGQWEGSC